MPSSGIVTVRPEVTGLLYLSGKSLTHEAFARAGSPSAACCESSVSVLGTLLGVALSTVTVFETVTL